MRLGDRGGLALEWRVKAWSLLPSPSFASELAARPLTPTLVRVAPFRGRKLRNSTQRLKAGRGVHNHLFQCFLIICSFPESSSARLRKAGGLLTGAELQEVAHVWLILSGDSRHHRPPVRTHLPADPRLAKAGRWHYPGAAPAEQGWAPLWAAHPPAEGPQACPFSLGLRFTWKQGTCPHRAPRPLWLQAAEKGQGWH